MDIVKPSAPSASSIIAAGPQPSTVPLPKKQQARVNVMSPSIIPTLHRMYFEDDDFPDTNGFFWDDENVFETGGLRKSNPKNVRPKGVLKPKRNKLKLVKAAPVPGEEILLNGEYYEFLGYAGDVELSEEEENSFDVENEFAGIFPKLFKNLKRLGSKASGLLFYRDKSEPRNAIQAIFRKFKRGQASRFDGMVEYEYFIGDAPEYSNLFGINLKKIGKGIGKAAKAVGKGVGKVVSGVGKVVSSVTSNGGAPRGFSTSKPTFGGINLAGQMPATNGLNFQSIGAPVGSDLLSPDAPQKGAGFLNIMNGIATVGNSAAGLISALKGAKEPVMVVDPAIAAAQISNGEVPAGYGTGDGGYSYDPNTGHIYAGTGGEYGFDTATGQVFERTNEGQTGISPGGGVPMASSSTKIFLYIGIAVAVIGLVYFLKNKK